MHDDCSGQGERDGDSEMVDAQHAPGESFQTVFLGTGAACPSKYRNVTSIYLDFYERGGLLLDCGEASLGQLIRYGEISLVLHSDIYLQLKLQRVEDSPVSGNLSHLP